MCLNYGELERRVRFSALVWLEQHSVKTKRISVAVGNEQVLQFFYEKFGFLPKAIFLEQISDK